jgi:hypothetical protein
VIHKNVGTVRLPHSEVVFAVSQIDRVANMHLAVRACNDITLRRRSLYHSLDPNHVVGA